MQSIPISFSTSTAAGSSKIEPWSVFTPLPSLSRSLENVDQRDFSSLID